MEYPKIYVGPMSQNVVDAIKEFSNKTGHKIGLIPSRRQVEFNGGYVNNWKTKDFSKYAKNLFLTRDHAGPNQGYNNDDGFDSLEKDCKYFNMIHIDPWKKYPLFDEGIEWTAKMIKYCHSLNPELEYEVGTEESIRKFEVEELDMFLFTLKKLLTTQQFNKIKYLVIQSGTSLEENKNTGEYDKQRLKSMIKVVKKYNLLSKEHNGDYLSTKCIKSKFKLGLDAINIAPEFGLIETLSYIEAGIDIDKFWKICYDSKRWEKWVGKDFNPKKQKLDLIKICGHYVFATKEFKKIKPNIKRQIKLNIKNKLNELFK